MSFINILEPPALLQHFAECPPDGFRIVDPWPALPSFETRFDLLTTAEPALQRRLARWPGARWWRRLLQPRTVFIGSTVSEYACFPRDTDPVELAAKITRRHARARPFLIVKDLPADSPLLEPADNAWNAALAEALVARGFVLVEGQALAWVPIDFADEDAYLARLSRGARRDIRRKLRVRERLRIEALPTGGSALRDGDLRRQMYALYEAVYAQSEIHFDHLSAAFFDALLQDADSQGIVFTYRSGGQLIGWNLCYVADGNLVDKYIGLSYPASRVHNLYAVSWMHNLDYARRQGLRRYIAGWTDPEVKARLGARFTFTRHAVRPRSRLLRLALRRLAAHFESDRQWFEEHK